MHSAHDAHDAWDIKLLVIGAMAPFYLSILLWRGDGDKLMLYSLTLEEFLQGRGIRHKLIPIATPKQNGKVERSHRTDDEEFYIPRIMRIKSEADLLNEAMGYIYYYDNVRSHSALNYRTPFAHLKSQLPDIDDKIRLVIPIMLDDVSVKLGPWSGYHVLVQHPIDYDIML
jgi:hypothetical protein